MRPAGTTGAAMEGMPEALLRTLVRLDNTNQYTLFLDSAEAAEPTPLRAAKFGSSSPRFQP